jgi:hypothetical protein
MKKTFLLTACFVLFLGLIVAFADKPQYSTKPATALFRDNFLGEVPDRIGSDGYGIYVDKVDRVSCWVDAYGIFFLKTWTSGSKRKLFIDFANPVTEAEDPKNYGQETPFLSGYFNGYVQNYDVNVNLWDMDIGKSNPTNFRVIIEAGWTVRFNPEERPGTTRILVTRISSDSWVFETVKDEELTTGDIGKLYKIETVNKKTVWYDHGNFHLPFKVTVKLKK